MEKNNNIVCPFCGSKSFHIYEESNAFNPYDRYECEECGRLFDVEDIEREDLRHQISCLLEGTSESSPKEIYFMIPSAEEEACGLSSLEIPHIDKVFEAEDGASLQNRILSLNGLHILSHAEEIGFGNRAYELIDLDD